MRYFSVKNLERFQHYKDRRPPWIKLYQDVLEDYEFTRLQDASKMHLLAIWLLASRTENRVPYDPEWIATTIHATSPVDLDVLANAGFIVPYADASGTLAGRSGFAIPEVEAEKETKPETETDAAVGRSWQPAAEQKLSERLTTSAGRNALSAVLKVAGSKVGVVAELEAIMAGDRGAQHRCTTEQLDVALSDYVTNGMSSGRWNAQHFRACVRRAMQPAAVTATPNGDGGAIVAKIRGLIKQNPGRSNYLPKQEVAALGDDVLRAYESVGGADRFLTVNPKDLPFLIRDFSNAMRATT